jgi:RNA polymerase sigma-70 factor, ECF subfamily
LSELGWVRRILRGDKPAGELLVAENYPAIQRMLWCLTGDSEIAADLTQQTFLNAWRALDSYRGEARIATWIRRIAYHEYLHWLRDRRPAEPLSSVEEMAGTVDIQDLKTIVLDRALAQLSDDLRNTFLLFYAQELSVAEVAAVLAVPKGTVKSRLFSARALLRELLAEPAADAVPASYARTPVP